MTSPMDFAEAREASRFASSLQKGCEQALRDASRSLAACERAYRLALAEEMLKLHAEGTAWTACEQLAKGHSRVAELRYERDLKKGLMESVMQQAYRHAADRRDLHSLLDWSKRRELAENGGPDDRLAAGHHRELAG